eukprot:TRINITY_DN38356_c0_g1_i1.p1 TRINITY_DN38356_c0_g1~~TRINITY_DN38356_c0_g1_i1.p1  ORF type:complete len:420 (+),score=143.89 TRINITY_DN38356_c0_g1_i1:141-1262(+)
MVAVPWYPLLRCKDQPLAGAAGGGAGGVATAATFWVVADPQIEGHKRGTRSEFWNNLMNDVYYAFITHTMARKFGPFDAVLMLGDLFSFQYHKDPEFFDVERRLRWAFQEPIPLRQEPLPPPPAPPAGGDDSLVLDPEDAPHDTPFYFLAGNHDVGYASELPQGVVARFERTFNKRHWVREVALGAGHPGLLLVACDGMELDGVLRSQRSWEFLKRAAALRSEAYAGHTVVLLTHIPLWKAAGSCPGDSPAVEYRDNGMVRWQHTLSESTTEWILTNMRPALVLSGHDHEGCSFDHPGGVTEVTVRSVLGDYSGNTALLSARRDGTLALQQCPFYRSQVVVAACIYMMVAVLLCILYTLCLVRTTRPDKEKAE